MYYSATVHSWRANVKRHGLALMHPAQIKAALSIAGFKQTEAAQRCGVAPTTVGAVIHGRSRSKAVEEWIAQATRLPLAELWPQWYGDGEVTLTGEERQLVRDFRTLHPAQREQTLALVQSLKLGVPTGSVVIGGKNSRIAGRDYISNKPKK